MRTVHFSDIAWFLSKARQNTESLSTDSHDKDILEFCRSKPLWIQCFSSEWNGWIEIIEFPNIGSQLILSPNKPVNGITYLYGINVFKIFNDSWIPRSRIAEPLGATENKNRHRADCQQLTRATSVSPNPISSLRYIIKMRQTEGLLSCAMQKTVFPFICSRRTCPPHSSSRVIPLWKPFSQLGGTWMDGKVVTIRLIIEVHWNWITRCVLVWERFYRNHFEDLQR